MHRALSVIAGDDLSGAIELTAAMAAYSQALDRIVEAALATARESTAIRHPIVEDLPFSVVAMGKWGANEVNYSSDIDLILVHADTDDGAGGGRVHSPSPAGWSQSSLPLPPTVLRSKWTST